MKRTRQVQLDTLMRLRRRREDTARHAMVLASGAATSAQVHIAMLRSNLNEANASARASLLGDVQTHMGAYRRRVQIVQAELSREARNLASAQKSLSARRAELADAIKQRRAMASLRRKLSAALLLDKRRRGQKELEETHAMHAATGFGAHVVGASQGLDR